MGKAAKLVSVEWAVSLDRLIEATNKDQRRVVRPVSPRINLRPPELVPPRPRRRQG